MKRLHSFVAEKNLNTKETPIQTSRPLVIFAVASTGSSLHLTGPPEKETISKPNHTILIKLCMWIESADV